MLLIIIVLLWGAYRFITLNQKSNRDIERRKRRLESLIRKQENQRAYFKNQLEKQTTYDNPTRNSQ